MTRQRRPAGTTRKPAAAGSKRARSGAKNQPKVEDVQQEIDHKSIVRGTVSKMLETVRKTFKLPRNCHDQLFKIILFTPKCLEILLRMALPKKVVDRINFNIDPIYLDRVYDELGEPKVELDGVILLTLYSGLFLQITLEHRSFYHVDTQFQIGYNTFRVWKRYFRKHRYFMDQLPETHALVVLHGRKADRHPPSMQQLCGIADEDLPYAFCPATISVFNGRDATIEDFGPAIHGGMLYALLHSHDRPICDAGVRYLAEAYTASPADSVIDAYVYDWLDITENRWQAAVSALPPAKQTEDIMGAMAKARLQEGRAMGRTEGMAESVLKVLETRFGPVSGTVEERIYAAEDSELDRLLGKVGIVPSVEALFNGYGGD